MNIADIAIRRPVFTTMVALGLIVLGLKSFSDLGVDLFPDINFPVVVINTIYPGAGPEEVESLVSRPLEDSLASINGLDRLKSFSREGLSTVIVQFKLETDIKLAAVDVREKVAKVRGLLPKDIEDPVIARLDPNASPILTYTVSADRSSLEIRQATEDVIKPGLEAVEGVAAVNVMGGLEREIQVNLSASKLQALGLSPTMVSQVLASEDLDVPAGRYTMGGQEIAIRAKGQFTDVAEIGEIVLPMQNGDPVKLKEVATIVDGTKEARVRTRVNGRPAVAFEVIKAPGTNTLAIVDEVQHKLAKLQSQLPPGYKVTNVLNAAVFIEENTHEVNLAIIFGGAMAILIIFLFMLDWRSTLISALALPISVITTFFVMNLLGFTLNMMSLLGLSLAIGLLIDDAVVVRENIFRHMEMGEDPMTAASKGTQEIALAVMATTFTIVAVFVPVGFTSGMIGQFFRQFGLTVAAAVLVSLFVAFTMDPMMSARLVKPIDHDSREKDLHHPLKGPILRMFAALDTSYRETLAWALQHRGVVVIVATVMLFGSLYLGSFMGSEFFPKPDRGQFIATLDMPAGTSIDTMDETVKRVEKLIAENPYIESQYTTVGVQSDPTKASIRVIAVDKNQRPQTLSDIKEEIRKKVATIPDLRTTMVEVGFIEGAVEAPITLNVRGKDYDTLLTLSERVREIVQSTPGTTDIDTSYVPGKPEYQVRIDRARAGDLGVSMMQLGLGLRNAVEGNVDSKLRQGDKEYDIRVRLQDADRDKQALLETYTVPSRSGRLVRLNEIASVTHGSGPSVIERESRQRQITITAGINERSLGDVVNDIQAQLDKLPTPEGYTMKFTGEAERMQDSMKALGIALLLGIIFIYLVLASQFESFIHPFTIMVSLPLAVVGAILGLFLTGSALGMSTFIGIILLMGLVTKNAILLVDYTNQLRDEGMDIITALLNAGQTRLRPILMTSMAMVLGMLPTALSTGSGSEFRAPMSTAVIGGVIVSTVLTLIVVPVVYTWMDRWTMRGRAERRAARQQSKEEASKAGRALKPVASLILLAFAGAPLTKARAAEPEAATPVSATDRTSQAAPTPPQQPAPDQRETKPSVTGGGVQTPPPEPRAEIPAELKPRPWGPERVITLQEASDLALKRNPDLAVARSRLAQTRLLLSRALAALQPVIAVGANYTRNSTEATLSLGPLITAYTDFQLYANGLQPQPLPEGDLKDFLESEIVIQPLNAYSFQASGSWGILNARTIPLYNQAKATIRATEASTSWQEREFLYGLAQAYYGLYALQQVVNVNMDQLQSRQRHLDLTRARFEAGQVAQSDVIRAEVEVVEAQRQLRESLQNVHNSAADLAVLLGLQDVELRAAQPEQSALPPSDDEGLVRRALEARSDLRAIQAQIQAARAAVLDAKLDFLPTIGLVGNYRYSNAAGFTGEKSVWAVGANASLPIWDGGLKLINLRSARQSLVQAEEQGRKIELQVRKEVQVAGSSYNQSRINLEAAEQEVRLARRTYDQMLALFEAGRATSLELRDAELLVTSAELGRVRAMLSQDLAALAVNRAVGGKQ